MRRTKFKIYLWVALCLAMLLSSNACAVLTASQVREARAFAKESAAYSALPGPLVQSYGVLLRDQKLLAVTRSAGSANDTAGPQEICESRDPWKMIQCAFKLEQDLGRQGRQMDAALQVLNDYSRILTMIVADDYSKELGENAATLGKSLDSATDTYNKNYSASQPLAKAGGRIAEAIRAAGGIYIRHRQTVILRDTLQEADPLVQGLIAEIVDVAQAQMKPAFENYEDNFLEPEFRLVAENPNMLTISTVSFVYDELKRDRSAVALSDQVATAALAYGKAHRVLVEKTRQKANLKGAIEEIQVLQQEISAARKVQAEVEK